MDYLFLHIVDSENNIEANKAAEIIPLKEILSHLNQHNRLISGALLSDSGVNFFDRAKLYWYETIFHFISYQESTGMFH